MKKFNYITLRDFLDFIKHFINLHKEGNDELNKQQVHINKGLQKIIQTEKTVNQLKASLAVKSVELDKKQQKIKLKFQKVMKDTEKARLNKEKGEKKQVETETMKKQIDERVSRIST